MKAINSSDTQKLTCKLFKIQIDNAKSSHCLLERSRIDGEAVVDDKN